MKVHYCDWKFQGFRYFGFAMATLQLFQRPENVKISILPFTPSQQKCYIFESIYRIPKKLFLAERWWRWLLWLNISRAQVFWFCNGNVTTFPTSRKCKNFNSSLYNVPAEMLYFRTYLTNSQKTFFGWKMMKVAIVGEYFKGFSYFWFCNGNVATFPTSRKCKNFNSSLYTVQAEMLYFRQVFGEFSKTFFWLQ